MAEAKTDSRLLDVAIDHFGRLGLEGASTRAIAADADTPMSSITYHFGGKEGLYLAAAEHIALQMGEWMGPAVARAAALCGPGGSASDARAALHAIVDRAVEVLAGRETESIARFIVREQADPTEAFNRIYDGAMSRMLARVVDLIGRVAGPRLDGDRARLTALTVVGQVLMFRVARATVLRCTGWKQVATGEIESIKAVVAGNLDAILDRLEAGATE